MYAVYEGTDIRTEPTIRAANQTRSAAVAVPLKVEAPMPTAPTPLGSAILGGYAFSMTALLLLHATKAHEGVAGMVVGVLYAFLFIAAPALFLKAEANGRGLTIGRLFREGFHSRLGRIRGRAVAFHMLAVPVTIGIAVTSFGTLYAATL